MNYEKFYEPHWTKEERENVKIVIDFVEMLKAKKFQEITTLYSDSDYIQHNPSMENGIKGVALLGQKLAKAFPEAMLDVKHIGVF